MTTIPPAGPPEVVVDLLGSGTDLIVPLANGEPVEVLDAVEAAAEAGGPDGIHLSQVGIGSILYDFLDGNPAVELLPVGWVNDPRVIAPKRGFVSINATLQVDLLGQAASETIGGEYWSGSGGQADFARGAMYSPGGQGFLVLPPTATHGTLSRILPRLPEGSAVTTIKNTVDKVGTEHGVAELRGPDDP